MATFNKFNSFALDMSNGKFNLASDQLVIALTNTAPVATNAVQTDITEISYTNCSSRNVSTTSNTQASGVQKLVVADLVLTASGAVGPFRYAVLYDSTATSKNLIGWYDYGSSITMATGETFTVDFDQVNGVFTTT